MQKAACLAAVLCQTGRIASMMRSGRRNSNADKSIEAGRLFNASARMMDTFQHGLLAFAKIRSGGQQTVVVQHVNVGDGERAMVAGQVKSQSKARTAKVEGGEPKNER